MSNGDGRDTAADKRRRALEAFEEEYGYDPTAEELADFMKAAEATDSSTDAVRAGRARAAAALVLAEEQIKFGRLNSARFRQAFNEALKSHGFLDQGERTKYLDAIPVTQAAVTAAVNNLQSDAGDKPPDPHADRELVEGVFADRMRLDPEADPVTVWQNVQTDYNVTVEGGPPSFKGPTEELGLLSKAGEEAFKLIEKRRKERTLTELAYYELSNLAGVTDADRAAFLRNFWTPPTTIPGGTGPSVEIEGGWGLETVTGTGPNVSGRTLIGLSGVTGTGVGVSPMSEYQRLQIELAEQRIDLDEAKQRWTETKEQFWQARAEATEKLNREKFNRAIFESDRSTRLRRDESLLTGRLTAAHQANQATLAALPYLAPKSEFLPGQEPGGSLARLKSFSGAEHVPVRTADVSVAFNADAAAEQALAEFDAKTSNI